MLVVVFAMQDFDVKPRRVHIEQIDVQKFTQGDFPEVGCQLAVLSVGRGS